MRHIRRLVHKTRKLQEAISRDSRLHIVLQENWNDGYAEAKRRPEVSSAEGVKTLLTVAQDTFMQIVKNLDSSISVGRRQRIQSDLNYLASQLNVVTRLLGMTEYYHEHRYDAPTPAQ